MTIAVDFDGTIVEHRYPAIGKEMPYAIDTLKRLQREGHKLILWSAREGKLLEEAVEFCHSRGLDFYAVNADLPDAKWENYKQSRKLRVDCFIDDRNLGGLPDWTTIYSIISRKLTYGDLINGTVSLDDEEEGGTRRKGLFARLRERSRESRERLTHHHSSNHRHHW